MAWCTLPRDLMPVFLQLIVVTNANFTTFPKLASNSESHFAEQESKILQLLKHPRVQCTPILGVTTRRPSIWII